MADLIVTGAELSSSGVIPISSGGRVSKRPLEGINPFGGIRPIYSSSPDGFIRNTSASEPAATSLPQTAAPAAGSGLSWDSVFTSGEKTNWFGLLLFGSILYGISRLVTND